MANKGKEKFLDVTAPGIKIERGTLHPLTQAIRKISEVFSSMGFEIASGPEVETEFFNFDALNVPRDHPARDIQDTFWVKDYEETVLRTQTSPVQIRYMQKNKPPVRIIVPGKVFRNEATDATHEAQFYQIEGLLVDENVSFANLKEVLRLFFSRFFETDISIRIRPGYFPFVEPGIEVDISCFKCDGGKKGCPICKGTGWIEVMGAGMVHPNVLKSAGINPTKYQGFAFGGGIDRFIMLKNQIDDIRLFYSGDLRFIRQF